MSRISSCVTVPAGLDLRTAFYHDTHDDNDDDFDDDDNKDDEMIMIMIMPGSTLEQHFFMIQMMTRFTIYIDDNDDFDDEMIMIMMK